MGGQAELIKHLRISVLTHLDVDNFVDVLNDVTAKTTVTCTSVFSDHVTLCQ